jgi:hypothetical protein
MTRDSIRLEYSAGVVYGYTDEMIELEIGGHAQIGYSVAIRVDGTVTDPIEARSMREAKGAARRYVSARKLGKIVWMF